MGWCAHLTAATAMRFGLPNVDTFSLASGAASAVVSLVVVSPNALQPFGGAILGTKSPGPAPLQDVALALPEEINLPAGDRQAGEPERFAAPSAHSPVGGAILPVLIPSAAPQTKPLFTAALFRGPVTHLQHRAWRCRDNGVHPIGDDVHARDIIFVDA